MLVFRRIAVVTLFYQKLMLLSNLSPKTSVQFRSNLGGTFLCKILEFPVSLFHRFPLVYLTLCMCFVCWMV